MRIALELLEPVLMADEIQGNILGGFNKDHQAIMPLRFAEDAPTIAAVRRWLAGFSPKLTWLQEVVDYKREFKRRTRLAGMEPADMARVWRNIAFSFPGLRKLSPQAEAFNDNVFREGLSAAASARLGDPVTQGLPGHIGSWVVGRPGEVPDIIVIIAGDDSNQVEAEVESFLEETRAAGLECPFYDIGHDLAHYNNASVQYEPGREHFGFKDGISHPGVRGRMSERADDFLTPRTVPDAPDPNEPQFGAPGQPLVCVGEFVLGYGRQNESFPRRAVPPIRLGPEPFAPDPNVAAPHWAKNGSYLVYRRLRQDVPAFNRFLLAEAARLSQHPEFRGTTAEALGALLVGRWRSGAPLMRSVGRDDTRLGHTSPANNEFGYGNDSDPSDGFDPVRADPFGILCPLAAHTRKVNPRDLNTDQGSPPRTFIHRLLRRGIPYGPPLPLGATEDPANQDRGLLFLSYQASIQDQFEFLARLWMNDRAKPSPFSPPSGSGFDMIVGQNPDPASKRVRFCLLQTAAGSAEVSTAGIPQTDWVISTGGGYFFAPSQSAIRDVLAQGN